MNTEQLSRLREKILDSDNEACFIERETILRNHAETTRSLPVEERYLYEFETLLKELSTPLEEDDVFAGRMKEARWCYPEPFTRLGVESQGHITIDMPTVLTRGLSGIAQEVSENARRVGTEESAYFERNAVRCIEAIRGYCERYADAAEALGKTETARALRVVPYKPAYDLYSALQSVWMMQFICSTVCGSRDFAPGRIDRYLLPYLSGDRERDVELLVFFLMKFNEITGTATDNYRTKPTPCFSSKQYLTLGPDFNELSDMIVEALEQVRLPQPTLNFRIADDYRLAGRAAQTLDAQCNFFNDKLIYRKLLNSGIPPEIAADYDFTACNRVDLPGYLYNLMRRIDSFENSLLWFRKAVFAAERWTDVPDKLYGIAYRAMLDDTRENRMHLYSKTYCFHLESLFLKSCVQTCRDEARGGAELFRWQHRMFSGIANMADSMVALCRLSERYSYREIREMLDTDFQGREALRREILEKFPKFGNGDPEADVFAARIGNVLIDAFEDAAREEGFIAMPSFYSLTRHAYFGSLIGATPDGRHAGDTVSENQSPVHGMDRNGPTALLRSVQSLPLKRCICGGLNLKFGTRPNADILAALLKSFFDMGGQHIGFSIADRATLEDARKHPENHRTLLVRKTGFSEFFTALSPEEQQEIIDRTEYGPSANS